MKLTFSPAKNPKAGSGTIVSPVAQVLNEKRPANFPSPKASASGFANRMITCISVLNTPASAQQVRVRD